MSLGPYDKSPEEKVEEEAKVQEERENREPPVKIDVPIDPIALDRLEVARRLGVEGNIQKHTRRLDRLIKWAKDKGAEDQEGVLSHIIRLRRVAGKHSSIHDLTLYARMDAEKDAIQKKMENIIPENV